MTDSAHLSAESRVDGTPIGPKHLAADTLGAAHCAGDAHYQHADSRTLREGSRVTVAVVADDYCGDWRIADLRCLHCPLPLDTTADIPDFSVYSAENVIVADATVAPATDEATPPTHDDYVLADPYIICSSVSIPTA